MFNKPEVSKLASLHIQVLASDVDLLERIKKLLQAERRCHVETHARRLFDLNDGMRLGQNTSLLIVEVTSDPRDLQALEKLTGPETNGAPVIVLADGLSQEAARALLKLRVSDWLKSTCSSDELLKAYDHAQARATGATQTRTRCTTFVSAIGGAGASTLALALLDNVIMADKAAAAKTCVVDLNWQSGVIADFLDIEPAFDLDEIVAAPERLDQHLLDVMFTRHKKEFSVLASPPRLCSAQSVAPNIVGHVLELVSERYEHVIIDMPSTWQPWSESLVRGSDDFFIVTDMTVAGMRHAHRQAAALGSAYGSDMQNSVIVNKAAWRSKAGVSKRNAKQLLGKYLAGFVSDAGDLPTEAQNKGVLLSKLKRNNPIRKTLSKAISVKH